MNEIKPSSVIQMNFTTKKKQHLLVFNYLLHFYLYTLKEMKKIYIYK